MDTAGNKEWDKTYGESNIEEEGIAVIQTTDGGYAVIGNIKYLEKGLPERDIIIIKTGRQGKIEWKKTYGENTWDFAKSLSQTIDEGYVIAGNALISVKEEYNIQVIKLDHSGTVKWQQNFGNKGNDYGYTVIPTTDWGYILTGSQNAGKNRNNIWIIKLKPETFDETSITNAERSMKWVPPVDVKLPVDGKYYALLIAVQNYQSKSGVIDLQHPHDDAKQLFELLVERYSFEKENITVLEDPGLLDISAALENLSDNLTESDNLLIFYAGHGYWDEKFKLGYWLPNDAHQNNRGSWFSNTELQDYIRAINTKHTLLIADACFSGSLFTQTRDAFSEASIVGSVYFQGDFTNNGAATVGKEFFVGGNSFLQGKVLFNGSSAQDVSGTSIFNDVDADNDVSLLGSVSIKGVIVVKTGNTLTSGGNLTLESGASLMHGTNTPNGNDGIVVGNINVQRTGTSSGAAFNFWSSPVFDENVNVLGGNRHSYEPANAPDLSVGGLRQAWVAASGTMNSARGYASAGGGTVSFTGNPGDAPTGSPITITINKPQLPSTEYNPWNLIGNPFPCALDADEFQDVNGPSGSGIITGALYFWDDDFSGGGGWSAAEDYAVYNLTGVNPRFDASSQLTSFNGLVASGQGFFVEKVDNGTGLVEFTNAMRSEGDNSSFFRRQGMNRVYLGILNPNNIYNEALIAFSDFTTDNYDMGYDSRKLKGNELLAFGTKHNGDFYAIQAFGTLNQDKIVPLALDARVTGTYEMWLMALEDMDETVVVLLEDTELGVFHNLSLDSVYEFSIIAALDIDRFLLHFSPPMIISTVKEGCDGNDGQILLEQPGNHQWDLILADQLGILIDSVANFNGFISYSGLIAGRYTLTLEDDYGYQVSKSITVDTKTKVAAEFEINPVAADINTIVSFNNLSERATHYDWDFGDGTVVSGIEHPTHTYISSGTYNIMLRAMNTDCIDEITREIYVNKVTGIVESDNGSDIQIFSYSKTIYLRLNNMQAKEAIVSIYNLVGQEIYNGLFSTPGLSKIVLDNRTENFYLVKVSIDNRLFKELVFVTE